MIAKTRRPVEPDNFKRFRLWLLEMEEMYGIAASKDVHRQVMLLVEEIDRQIFDAANPKKADITPVRKFVAMFHNHYRLMTDYEYGRKITSVEVKTIETLVGELNKVSCDVEDYLRWFFERFLPENEKMCPPTVGLACSKFSLSKFLYEHREEIKKREEKALLHAAERDLYNRSKILVQKTDDSQVHIWAEQYRSGNITLEEWRSRISEAESAVNNEETK